jgi:hypothetical protein
MGLVMGCLFACGSDDRPIVDAPPIDAPPIDAPTCPKTLLAGGTDVTAQGWMVGTMPPFAMSNGADHVRLETSTAMNANTSGMQLLRHPTAVTAGMPYKLRIEMMVVSVGQHNRADAGAAILGAFTPQFGVEAERLQMIYLDSNGVGWADDSQAFAFNVTDGAYHTYELHVGADNVARFFVDGTQALMRNNFLNNGLIAIGDQTNEPGLDSVLQIRSVTLLCL